MADVATTIPVARRARPSAAAGTSGRRITHPVGVLATLVIVALLTGCGGGGDETSAAPPARAGTGGTGASGGSPTAGAGDSAPPTASDSTPAGAAQVVTAYFTEIDAASRAGRVADVTTTALPGCQSCALDVGVTRGFAQRGLRADADPYVLSAVTANPRQGVVITVLFTAETRTVGLVDPANRRVDQAAGAGTRAGAAQLTLTSAGWRIQTIRYAHPGQSLSQPAAYRAGATPPAGPAARTRLTGPHAAVRPWTLA